MKSQKDIKERFKTQVEDLQSKFKEYKDYIRSELCQKEEIEGLILRLQLELNKSFEKIKELKDPGHQHNIAYEELGDESIH